MGTTTSTSNNGDGVIDLSSGSKCQAYLSHPKQMPSTLGLLILCDSDTSFFDAPEARQMTEYFSLSGGFIAMSLDLTTTSSPEPIQEKISDAVSELRSRGASVISICGYGVGGKIALECAQTTDFNAVAVVSPQSSPMELYQSVQIPIILVLTGIDEEITLEHRHEIIKAVKSSGLPSKLRYFSGQQRGFFHREQSLASTLAMNDIMKWFRKHNRNCENWRVDDLLDHPPVEEDWWNDDEDKPKFQNVGESNWHKTREKWRDYKDKKRPKAPKLVPYDAVVEGFVEPLRNFELPGKMSLPNMVSVLTDIWEIEGVT